MDSNGTHVTDCMRCNMACTPCSLPEDHCTSHKYVHVNMSGIAEKAVTCQRGVLALSGRPENPSQEQGCLQTNMYQQGLQLTVLKVLSTTQSVPNAYTVACPSGAIESVCIGRLASHLLATSTD